MLRQNTFSAPRSKPLGNGSSVDGRERIRSESFTEHRSVEEIRINPRHDFLQDGQKSVRRLRRSKTAAENDSHPSSTRAVSDIHGTTDLPKGLSPTTANQTAFFFRSLVRFDLLAVTISVAA